MSDHGPVDEPRREKQTMDGPQEEFIEDSAPSNTQEIKEKKLTWEDSWRPEDKSMESSEKEILGIDQDN